MEIKDDVELEDMYDTSYFDNHYDNDVYDEDDDDRSIDMWTYFNRNREMFNLYNVLLSGTPRIEGKEIEEDE